MTSKIYFDYAATAPADPEVVKAMEPYFFTKFGNASSPHAIGQAAQKTVEESRECVARLIGAHSDEIVFNSGGTEGANHAIFGVARALRNKGKHIIVSPLEHHCVLEPIELLRREGFDISVLHANQDGIIDPAEVQKLITPQTILVAVMHANNEIGTLQPIAEIGIITKQNKVTFLVDAVQTVGHIPVNVNVLNADLLTMSAHKFYGPPGVGALFIRRGTKIEQFLLGGDQEKNRRASTVNLPGIVGLAKAMDLCQNKMNDEARTQSLWRDRLLNEIPKLIEGVKVNGDFKNRLPNNAHFSFENILGESLLLSLDMAGFAASQGSACTSGEIAPSHVLKAIGLSDALAMGSLRISLGRWTKENDIEQLLQTLPGIIKSLRS
jgi:cysteine desulfurase